MLVLKHVGKNVLVQERLCQKKGGPTIIEAEKLVQKVSSVFYSSNFYMKNIANAAMKHFRALKVQTKGNKALRSAYECSGALLSQETLSFGELFSDFSLNLQHPVGPSLALLAVY